MSKNWAEITGRWWAKHQHVDTGEPSGDEWVDKIRTLRRARLRNGEGSGFRLLAEFEHEKQKLQRG